MKMEKVWLQKVRVQGNPLEPDSDGRASSALGMSVECSGRDSPSLFAKSLAFNSRVSSLACEKSLECNAGEAVPSLGKSGACNVGDDSGKSWDANVADGPSLFRKSFHC